MEKENIVKEKAHPVNVFISVCALLILAGGIVYLVNYFVRACKYEETNDAQVEAYINPVSARVGGYIRKVRFREHERVRKGDTLVTLDDQEYIQRVREAEATVNNAAAELNVLEAGIKSAETGTLVNRDQIAAEKSRLWQQQKDIDRYSNLVKEEAATGQEYEQVKSRFDVATSDFNAARDNLRVSEAKITELVARRALLKTDMERKEAGLALARINLDYTVITAPADGTMGRKTILEGQQVQPGQTLVSIVKHREIWVTANFKETQVNGMYVGQPVDISVDAVTDKTYRGTIEAIAASTGSRFSLLPADNSTGNFVKIVQRIPVKIRFTDTDLHQVRVGMNAKVSVLKKRSNGKT